MHERKYRGDMDCNTYDHEEAFENKHLEYVSKDEVFKMIDDIEARVNVILADLKPITGLTEIEAIKHFVKELSEDLY